MELDKIYEQMHVKNRPTKNTDVIYDETLDTQLCYCYAIYALGHWCLHPAWIRVNTWLKSIIPNSTACFYSVHPEKHEGLLHQTLLQFVSFNSFEKYSDLDIDRSIQEISKHTFQNVDIMYKGIVFTKTGLALKGYTDEETYRHIMNVRHSIEYTLKVKNLPVDIPYSNDILHATIMRWKKIPTQEMIDQLNKGICRWDECEFGRIQISNWVVGKASWKMIERCDMINIPVPKLILHRGNTGKDDLLENHPDTFKIRDNRVECDIWMVDNMFYLGHDSPQYLIKDFDVFVQNSKYLIHAKDGRTFATLVTYCKERGYDAEIFYHTNEDYVLTTRGTIIAYPGKYIYPTVMCMMPENMGRSMQNDEKANISSICSDKVYYYLKN